MTFKLDPGERAALSAQVDDRLLEGLVAMQRFTRHLFDNLGIHYEEVEPGVIRVPADRKHGELLRKSHLLVFDPAVYPSVEEQNAELLTPASPFFRNLLARAESVGPIALIATRRATAYTMFHAHVHLKGMNYEWEEILTIGVDDDADLVKDTPQLRELLEHLDPAPATLPSVQTHDPTPETDSPTPETDSSTPETDGSTSGTDSTTPATDNPTPATDGSTPTTDNPTPATDNPTPATDGSTPTTDSSTPTTDGSTPTTDSPTSATDSSTPTAAHANANGPARATAPQHKPEPAGTKAASQPRFTPRDVDRVPLAERKVPEPVLRAVPEYIKQQIAPRLDELTAAVETGLEKTQQRLAAYYEQMRDEARREDVKLRRRIGQINAKIFYTEDRIRLLRLEKERDLLAEELEKVKKKSRRTLEHLELEETERMAKEAERARPSVKIRLVAATRVIPQ